MKIIKLMLLGALVASGCGDDGGGQAIDARQINETGTPTTHDELINACPAANVTRIMKTSTLPLLNADGSLPPLP
jgi:hypothetical protein